MPLYQFRCFDCSKNFEKDLSMDEVGKKKVTCPFCQKKAERVYTFTSQTKGLAKSSPCVGGTCPFMQ